MFPDGCDCACIPPREFLPQLLNAPTEAFDYWGDDNSPQKAYETYTRTTDDIVATRTRDQIAKQQLQAEERKKCVAGSGSTNDRTCTQENTQPARAGRRMFTRVTADLDTLPLLRAPSPSHTASLARTFALSHCPSCAHLRPLTLPPLIPSQERERAGAPDARGGGSLHRRLRHVVPELRHRARSSSFLYQDYHMLT